MKLKRKLSIILTVCILILTNLTGICLADDIETEEIDIEGIKGEILETSGNISDEPVINSRAAIVFDRNSKCILYSKNADIKKAMASTTKIMTSIIVLENCEDLNRTVTITQKAAGTGGSRLGLKKDDKITIYDLLYGLMLRSGNDAAVALAIEIGGSIEGFADLMNAKAKELGLANTHFVTPHGLDNNEHYTTAYELAVLTDYSLKNEDFAKIVGTKNYTITVNGSPKQLNNTNELLGVLNGVVGVKTGFTNNAGRCLVTETKRGDMDIITVVLGADTKKYRTKDSIELIEYTFSNFTKVNIQEKAEEEFESWKAINLNRINLIKSKQSKINLKLSEFEKVNVPIRKDKIDSIEYCINAISEIEAPIEQNRKIGTLTIKLDGEILESIDIICSEKVERKTWWNYFKESLLKCQTIYKYLYEN